MNKGNHFFSKVNSIADQEEVFDLLLIQRREVLCRQKDKSEYQIWPFEKKGEFLLCTFTGLDFAPGEEVILYFSLTDQRNFFLKTKLKSEKTGQLSFPTNGSLYLLQRRENFRVPIPKDYFAQLVLTSLNEEPFSMTLNIEDFSAGGVRAKVSENIHLFKVQQKLKGELNIGKKTVEAPFIIRHINKVQKTLGLQVDPLPPLLESKLYAISTELYRELFLREKEKKRA